MASDVIVAFVAGRLQGDAATRVEAHIDACQACFKLLGHLARTTLDGGIEAGSAPVGPVVGVPRRIEEYYLLRPIGQGAMGQVYLAVDTRLDRRVAIKILRVETRSEARERFLVEARAVARLSHPNVVTIHRVGEIQDRPYLVHEFVRGKSLEDVGKPLPWRRALELAIGLARGLEAAHAAGVLHRDIKPANAILGENGVVKLLDFGLAKLVEPSGDGEDSLDRAGDHRELLASVSASAPQLELTRTGALLGTPLYMAPEAWQGGAATASMDLYALGAVVHELCTGRRVHAATTFEGLRRAVLERPAASLTTLVAGIDPGFAAAIDRCLARDPGARWPSAQALRVSLEDAEAAPAAATIPPPRPRRVAWVAALAVLALLAAVGAIMIMGGARTRGASPAPVRARAAPSSLVCGPDRWCWDAGAPVRLNDLWSRARDDAWAVGSRGTIRHWDGRAWSPVPSGTYSELGVVHGASASDVWAVGAYGTVLHWDGGRWQLVDLGTRETFGALVAIAADDVWIGGTNGLAYHWDGGTWKPVATGMIESPRVLVARARNDIWAIAGVSQLAHWDGARWTAVASETDQLLTGLWIAGPDEIWVTGFHGIARQRVNGRWADVELPLTPSEREDHWFSRIWASGPYDVWLLSKRDPLLHWDGLKWSQVDPHTPRELYALSGSGPDDLWASDTTEVMVHWDGHDWSAPQPPPPTREYRAVWAAAPDDVWAVGYQATAFADVPRHGLIMRHDGERWRELDAAGSERLLAVWGASARDVWLAGDKGALLHFDGQAVRAVDAGVRVTLRGLAGARADDVWAVGDGGTTLHYDGRSWRSVASGTTLRLNAVCSVAGQVWVVGEGSALLRWDGHAWQASQSQESDELWGCWGSRPDDVWAVGGRGMVLRWNGAAWSRVLSDTANDLRAVSGSGPDDVWAVSGMYRSGQGQMLHWDGRFWSALNRSPRSPMFGVWAISEDDAWAVGMDGTIQHYEPFAR